MTILLLIFHCSILLISFYMLAKVSDEYFVGSLELIAKKWKISPDAAGATLMAVGSSAPELFVAMAALIKPGDYASVGMGTIVGSALFNVLVIIGISSIVKKSLLAWQPIIRDMIFYLLSIILLLLFFIDGRITFLEAVTLVLVYAGYVLAVIYWKKILKYTDTEEFDDFEKEKIKTYKVGWKRILVPLDFVLEKSFPGSDKFYWIFAISIGYIVFLSWVLVESAVKVSELLGVPPVIIALTVLAAGTSLPDLISSVVVAKKGKGGMAISNALGSNVFDILIGLGLPWVILLAFSKNDILVGTENLISSVFLLFATVVVILFLLFVRKWKIGKRSGYLLLALYLAYLVWAIIQAI